MWRVWMALVSAFLISGCAKYFENRYDDVKSAYYSSKTYDATKLQGRWVSVRVEEVGKDTNLLTSTNKEVLLAMKQRFVWNATVPKVSITFLSKALSFPETEPDPVSPLSGFRYFVTHMKTDPSDRECEISLYSNELRRTAFNPPLPIVFFPETLRIVEQTDRYLELASSVRNQKGEEVFHIIRYEKVSAKELARDLKALGQVRINNPITGLDADFWKEVGIELL